MFETILAAVVPVLKDIFWTAAAALLAYALNKLQAHFNTIWIMAQITHTKLKDLNVLKLYEHYGALERSLPLLTPESQEVARAELEACANLRSEKIDRIYYAMAAHEDALERIKKEAEHLTAAKRHHESQLRSLKGLLSVQLLF